MHGNDTVPQQQTFVLLINKRKMGDIENFDNDSFDSLDFLFSNCVKD